MLERAASFGLLLAPEKAQEMIQELSEEKVLGIRELSAFLGVGVGHAHS